MLELGAFTPWLKKGRKRLCTPGPCHFNKEQTPPGDLFDPSPRIHGGCFGVWGTPPPKPLNCKIVPNRSGARTLRPRWAKPTREEFNFLGDHSCLAAANLIGPALNNSWFNFIFWPCRPVSGNKKPCLHAVSRVMKIVFRSFTCLPWC
jgi:hypothetical protein